MNNSSDVFHLDLPEISGQEESKSDSEDSNNNVNVPEVNLVFVS